MKNLFRITFWDHDGYYDVGGQTVLEIRERIKTTLPSRVKHVKAITPVAGDYPAHSVVGS